MITWGFIPSYSDEVVFDTAFTSNGLTLIAAYISITGASGDIVWENNQGQAQWLPNAQAGQTYILGAKRILSVGTVNGTPRSTTASGLVWLAINQLNNSP